MPGEDLTLTARAARVVLTAVLLALLPASVALARRPTYRTPGYPGLSAVPKFTGTGSPSLKPGRPVKLGGGYRPHLIVDAAGTGHIVFSTSGRAFGPPGEETTTAGADHYCRLPRGATACTDTATLVPPETYDAGPGDTSPFFDNQPGFNTDIGEGARPLSTGSSLLILMHRANNVLQVPGGYSEDGNFLYSSDDGGKTFTGPGIVGTLDYESGAVVYGGKTASIGVLGTTQTTLSNDPSHDYFQGAPAGAFAPASTGAQMAPTYGSGDGRSLVLDGTRPVAAFNTINDIIVREYSGSGDINDPANWSESTFPGTGATLTGGDHGVWLAYHPIGITLRAVVVRLVNGHRAGPQVGVFPPILSSQDDQIAESAGGGLTAAWVGSAPNSDVFNRLTISTSSDGRHWSKPRVIARTGKRESLDGLQIATAPDGGGFAMYVHGKVNDGNPLGGFSIGGQIVAVPFGPSGPTGQKGLGGLSGGSGSGGSAGCLDVRFGAVHAHVDAGCFLRDPDDPTGSAAIAYGGVHVNGLELRPDAPGTAIVIDPRTHSIDGVHGTVSVLLQTPGVPDIKLWDGSLHAYLGSHDRAGDLLFALPMSGFQANVLGFRPLGTVDVNLASESVQIPMALQLPRYMHATGQATLVTDTAHDLERSSLQITIPDLAFTGLEIAHTRISYSGPAEQWTGTAELQVPPAAGASGLDVKDAQVAFDHGDFASGTFDTAPYPGTSLHRNAFLEGFAGSFDLHPPQRLTGTAQMGAIPQGSDGYALEATGDYAVDFGDPSVMTTTGDGAIEGLPLANARARFTTGGQFSETGGVGLDEAGVSLQGTVDATASLADATFSGHITGSFSVEGVTLASKSIPFNNVGFGVCEDNSVGPVHVSTGFFYKWNGGLSVSPLDCDSGPSAGSQARVSANGVAVAPRTDAEEIVVHGAGGAPSVGLVDPGGHNVAVSTSGGATAAAVAIPLPQAALTAVAIRHPAPGIWHVTPAPGSVPITSITAARGYPAARVGVRVTGHGRRRTLIYRASLHPGLTVRFAEAQGARILKLIGSARRARGRIRFVPADAPAGSRFVVALLSGLGTIPNALLVSRYQAPGFLRLARPRVRIGRSGRAFVIRIGRETGAEGYRVTARTAGGRRINAVLRSRVLRVPAAGWSDRISATVTAISAAGHAGHPARASLRVRYSAPRFHARAMPRRKRHRK